MADGPPYGNSLALLTVPSIFDVEGLLDTEEFVAEARTRGHDLGFELLADLHAARVLMPLFRIGDARSLSWRLKAPAGVTPGYPLDRAWAAAAAGRLHDPAREPLCTEAGKSERATARSRRWPTRLLYSPWQLLDVAHALQHYRMIKAGTILAGSAGWERWRRPALALAALSPRYLPGVLGQVGLRPAAEDGCQVGFGASCPVLGVLRIAEIGPARLQDSAHRHVILSRARGPVDKRWHLAAAKMLLRAHSHFAAPDHVRSVR